MTGNPFDEFSAEQRERWAGILATWGAKQIIHSNPQARATLGSAIVVSDVLHDAALTAMIFDPAIRDGETSDDPPRRRDRAWTDPELADHVRDVLEVIESLADSMRDMIGVTNRATAIAIAFESVVYAYVDALRDPDAAAAAAAKIGLR